MHEYALSTSVESAARWFVMTLLKSQKWSKGSCSPRGWTGLVGTDLAPNVIHVSAHTEFGVWALNSIQGTKSREFRRTKSASQWKSQVAISGEQDCYSQHLSEHQIMNETNTTVPDAREGISPFWYFTFPSPACLARTILTQHVPVGNRRTLQNSIAKGKSQDTLLRYWHRKKHFNILQVQTANFARPLMSRAQRAVSRWCPPAPWLRVQLELHMQCNATSGEKQWKTELVSRCLKNKSMHVVENWDL